MRGLLIELESHLDQGGDFHSLAVQQGRLIPPLAHGVERRLGEAWMPAIGKGVEEIRVSDSSGAYRVIYLARRAEAVYVLHAFHKKTQATPR